MGPITANSSKCATEDQMILQTSLLLRINVIIMTIVAIITFILTYKALFILKIRPIFHSSTKILLYTSLLFVNVHAVIFMVIQNTALIRSFTLSDKPCEIMRTTLECRFQNHVLIFGIAGVNFNQFGLTVDRLLATIIPQSYSHMGALPGVILSVLVVACSIAAPLIIAIGDPYDDIVPNCFFFPEHSAPRANIFLVTLSTLVITSIFLNFIIIYANKKLEKGCRTRFYVTQRYQKREALISTRIISYIAASQFLGLTLYSTMVLTLRLHKSMIPISIYHNMVWWAYTVPFAAVSLPALLIYRINQVGSNRKRVINRITAKVETQEEHMKSLKEL
nr:chemosensory receptor [Caenorhabditis elegans]